MCTITLILGNLPIYWIKKTACYGGFSISDGGDG